MGSPSSPRSARRDRSESPKFPKYQPVRVDELPKPLQKPSIAKLIDEHVEAAVAAALAHRREAIHEMIKDESERTNALLVDRIQCHAVKAENRTADSSPFFNKAQMDALQQTYNLVEKKKGSPSAMDMHTSISKMSYRSSSGGKTKYRSASKERYEEPESPMYQGWNHPDAFYEQYYRDHPNAKKNPYMSIMAPYHWNQNYGGYGYGHMPYMHDPRAALTWKNLAIKGQTDWQKIAKKTLNFNRFPGHGYGAHDWHYYQFLGSIFRKNGGKLSPLPAHETVDPIYQYLDPISVTLQERVRQGGSVTSVIKSGPGLEKDKPMVVFDLKLLGDEELY